MDAKWFIPIALFLLALYSAYRGYRASQSNSTTQLPDGRGTVDNTGNVPFIKTGGGVFSLVLLAAAIIITIVMNSER